MTIVKNVPDITYNQAIDRYLYDSDGRVFYKAGWANMKSGTEVGGVQTSWNGVKTRRFRIGQKKFLVHQLVWLLHNREWPTQEIDHINGDTLDNRIENLRQVSRTENLRNKRLYKTNRTGVSGVKICRGKLHVTIGNTHVGVFAIDDFESAVNARKQAEKSLGYHENHGRFGATTHKGALR
jgi:hypothetical protein